MNVKEDIDGVLKLAVSQDKWSLINSILLSIKVDKQKSQILLDYVDLTKSFADRLPCRAEFVEQVKIELSKRKSI